MNGKTTMTNYFKSKIKKLLHTSSSKETKEVKEGNPNDSKNSGFDLTRHPISGNSHFTKETQNSKMQELMNIASDKHLFSQVSRHKARQEWLGSRFEHQIKTLKTAAEQYQKDINQHNEALKQQGFGVYPFCIAGLPNSNCKASS